MPLTVTLSDLHSRTAWCSAAEQRLSQALAAAANYTSSTADHLLIEHGDGDGCPTVPVFCQVPPSFALTEDSLKLTGTTATGATWSRGGKDAFLRLVDRAVQRVYPPLDPLQFTSPLTPSFKLVRAEGENEKDVSKEATPALPVPIAVVYVRPTPLLHHTSRADQQQREGEEVEADRGSGCGQFVPHAVEGEVPALADFFEEKEERTSAKHTAGGDHDDGAVDDLWAAVRAARTTSANPTGMKPVDGGRARSVSDDDAQKGSEACDSEGGESQPVPRDGGDEANVRAEEGRQRARRLQWRLARWMADRFVNEASWAKGRGAPSKASAASSAFTVAPSAAPALVWSSFSPQVSSVLDAALAQGQDRKRPRPETEASAAGGEAETETFSSLSSVSSSSRVVHADVRGIEFDALLVGHTARYAYLAVPYLPSARFDPPRDASHQGEERADLNWVIVSRVPTPAWVTTRPPQSKHAAGKKGARDASLKGGGHSTWVNFQEALLHDDAASFTELPESERVVVTVRAHRVFAKRANSGAPSKEAALSPVHLSVWMEDAYVTSVVRSSYVDTGDSATNDANRGTHSWSDVLNLIRESCARYCRTGRKLCALRAAHKAAATAQQTPQGEAGVAEASGGTSPGHMLHPLEERALASAESLYAFITDTVNVRFKKLRGKQVRHAVPVIQTSTDLAPLHESTTVEFKYRLAAYANELGEAEGSSVMNAERLRHTLAAMAAEFGGAIAIGVADNGDIVGHRRGEVVRHLRTTGFCPAMVKDSVVVKELPVRMSAPTVATTSDRASSSSSPSSTLSSPPPPATTTTTTTTTKVSLPANWWKTGLTNVTAAASASNASSSQHGTEEARVVTVVVVGKGQAPFYCSSRRALPYGRGCASTTPLPMVVLAWRLLNNLMVVD